MNSHKECEHTLSDRSIALPLHLAILHHMIQHTPLWVRQVTLHPPIALLRQVARDTRQCPTRTCSADERVQLAPVGLRPDFRPGRSNVSPTIGGVVELIGPDGVVEGFGVSTGLVVVVLRIVECDGY